MVSKKRNSLFVWMGLKNQSLMITVWHHKASLVMPNSDPWDRFIYPTLTLMMDADMTQGVLSIDLIVWNGVKKLQWSTSVCSYILRTNYTLL